MQTEARQRVDEISPQRLHILQELEKLGTIAQGLKKENVAFCEHWKLSVESTHESFQNLGAQYGLLQKKYLAESSECKRLSEEIKKLKGKISKRDVAEPAIPTEEIFSMESSQAERPQK